MAVCKAVAAMCRALLCERAGAAATRARVCVRDDVGELGEGSNKTRLCGERSRRSAYFLFTHPRRCVTTRLPPCSPHHAHTRMHTPGGCAQGKATV